MDYIKQKTRSLIISLLIVCIIVVIAACIVYQKKSDKQGMPSVAQIHITSNYMNEYELQWGDGYVDAAIHVEAEGDEDVEGTGRIKLRGNSTLEADKLSYAFKFNDNVDLLGMGKGKKWVLLANAYDPTLMRNYIALETARKLRLNYTSGCRFADLWINDIYEGNYLVTEPIQDGSDRVDIHPAAGDFLVEYERSRKDEEETSYIVTDAGYRYLIHDPKNPGESQAEYVLDVMNHVEEVISEVQGADVSQSEISLEKKNEDTHEERTISDIQKTDTLTGKLSTVIDIDSFVDYCVFAEFMKSVDMGFSSEFYYYKNGILYAGPVWDYDLSAGNVNSSYYTHYSNLASTGDSAEGFWIDEQGKLLKELMECPGFEQMVWDRYRSEEVQEILTDIYEEGGLIDEIVKAYADSFDNNYSVGVWEEGKQYFAYAGTPLSTFEENVDYLKQWYKRRNEWMLDSTLK